MERTKGRLVGETKAQQEFEFVFDLMRWDWVETWNWNKERCCHYEIIKILFWFWACSLIIPMNGRLMMVCVQELRLIGSNLWGSIFSFVDHDFYFIFGLFYFCFFF